MTDHATSQKRSWRRSSACNDGECLEISDGPGQEILLRRSPDAEPGSGTVLQISVAEWRAFAAAVRRGEFDDL
jgi:hypothetical protein